MYNEKTVRTVIGYFGLLVFPPTWSLTQTVGIADKVVTSSKLRKGSVISISVKHLLSSKAANSVSESVNTFLGCIKIRLML